MSIAKKYIVTCLEARRVVWGFAIPTALNLEDCFVRPDRKLLAVSGMPLLSHDSVSNMSHGPDSPTTVAVVAVVFFFVFHFCGLVCQELKRIRLCTSLLCSGISCKKTSV